MEGRNPAKNLILLALLAALCVGAAELTACRFAAPEVYEEIVTPVRNLYHAARGRVKNFSDDYAKWLTAQGTQRDTLSQERARRVAEHRRQRAEQRRLRAQRDALEQEVKRLNALQADAQIATDPAILRTLSIADPAVTELVTETDGREYLTGGDMNLYYYNQKDEPWAQALYGQDPIGGYGCGPTALAMAVSTLTGETVTPAELAAWAKDYSVRGSGSKLSIVEGAAAHYGLQCTSLTGIDADGLYGILAAGGLVVALMGPGHFTARGHFILLHGATLSGEILTADPNSRENSLMTWDPELILSELSRSRTDGAPLWLLTAPMNG